MRDIKKLVNDENYQKMKFSTKTEYDTMTSKIYYHGEKDCLELAMEEIGELIEVITKTISGKKDYYHIAEEIVDVQMAIDTLEFLFQKMAPNVNIKKKDVPSSTKKQQSAIFSSIEKLAKTQRLLSKCIRNKKKAFEKSQTILDNLTESTAMLIKLYNIKSKDIRTIRNIKVERDLKRYCK